MKRLATFAFGFALVVAASPLAAQGDLLSACDAMQIVASPSTITPPAAIQQQFRFLCGQVVDAVTNVQPTIGIAFSGGAHTLGTASTIGRRLGVPSVSVTARVNAALADVPDLLDGYTPTFTNNQLTPMGTTGIPVSSIQGDATIGLFNGFSFGPAISGLGAVDLLGSVSFIPAVEQTGLAEDIINWGAGARIGILKQGLLAPGISVSGMYRRMGDVSFGDIAAGDAAEFGTDLQTISLRAGISKGILAFDFAAGGGYDIYKSNVHFDFVLDCPASECGGVPVSLRPQQAGSTTPGIEGELTTAAWNVYGDVGLSLLLLNVVGEVGYQKATDVVTPEDLQNAGLPAQTLTTDALEGGRFFVSVGVRVTL